MTPLTLGAQQAAPTLWTKSTNTKQGRNSPFFGCPGGNKAQVVMKRAVPAENAARLTVTAKSVSDGNASADSGLTKGSEHGQAPFLASVTQSTSPAAPSGQSSQTPGGAGLLGLGLVAAAGLAVVLKALESALASRSPATARAPSISTVPGVPELQKAADSFLSRTVTQAAPAALTTIYHYFPQAMVDDAFVAACAKELSTLGFTKDNCIALVNTCRDEICRPLSAHIDKQFGLSFNIAGLGGLINCGKTGMKAGMSHSPQSEGLRERYVFFAFPHVSIGENGEVGAVLRRGRGKPSSACGALIAIKDTASSRASEDPDDAEFVLLKNKVLATATCRQAGQDGLNLVTVTKAAREVIAADLEALIEQTVDPAVSDYAVITGIQIHSSNQIAGQPFRVDRMIDYVAPGLMYAVVRGKRYEIEALPAGGSGGSRMVHKVAV